MQIGAAPQPGRWYSYINAMVYRLSPMQRLLTGLLLAGSFAGLPFLGTSMVAAQDIQPTGKPEAVTRNPQSLEPQNFGSAGGTLQQSTTPEVLGTSINQLDGGRLTISVSRPPALLVAPTTTEDVLNEPQPQLQDPGLKLDKIVGTIAAFLVLLAGVVAVYLAAKRSMV